MASAALTTTTLVSLLQADSTERLFTSTAGKAGQYNIVIQNVGSNPAAISIQATIGVDPDAPSGNSEGEAIIPIGGSFPLPSDVAVFYYKSTSGTYLNVILDKRQY